MDPSVTRAVDILRSGGLVAFPTETVYGLGADATNPAAVARIFAAKGRPSTNPVIAHVADAAVARRYAAAWPEAAERLSAAFWPGPLTIVLPKAPAIAAAVSAGRDTVGLRVPDHPLSLALLRAFDGPVAAPSANRSTRVSPTTAEHVREELGDRVDLILDGGPCRVGIESTVLDLSGDVPVILRPGSVTRRQIESQIGPVDVFRGSVDPTRAAASPGQHAIHYAPAAPAYRFEPAQAADVARWCGRTANEPRTALFCGRVPPELSSTPFLLAMTAPADPDRYAHDLYAALRRLDVPGIGMLLVAMPPDAPAWAAVRDRITRATRPLPT